MQNTDQEAALTDEVRRILQGDPEHGRIKAIRHVRTVTNWDLHRGMAFVDNLPPDIRAEAKRLREQAAALTAEAATLTERADTFEAQTNAEAVELEIRFQTLLRIAADTPESLRRCDVLRVLEAADDPGFSGFTAWLKGKRPDLTAEIDEMAQALRDDAAALAAEQQGAG